MRPVGQAVKTTPSHGVNPGSIPGQVSRKLPFGKGFFWQREVFCLPPSCYVRLHPNLLTYEIMFLIINI